MSQRHRRPLSELKPVAFTPTILDNALKLTGNVEVKFLMGDPLVYAYVHYSIEQSRPWWFHFYGDAAPDLVLLLKATPLAALGGMFRCVVWAEFVAGLKETILDPDIHQWVPSLPSGLASQVAPSSHRLARAWRDLYNVVCKDNQPIEVEAVRPVWYEDQRPVSAVMERERVQNNG